MRTVSGPTDHVVVVGAGLSGLAATLHLLGAGRRVTVFEREEYPGGRAGQLDLDGFHIDTGPTVLTMPDLLDEALAAVGESLSDRLDLVQPPPRTVPSSPTDRCSTSTPTRTRWPTRSLACADHTTPRGTCGYAPGCGNCTSWRWPGSSTRTSTPRSRSSPPSLSGWPPSAVSGASPRR